MVDVGDSTVGRVLRIDGEVHTGDDPLVGPRVVPPDDIDSDDLR
jgi:hypothetical protein